MQDHYFILNSSPVICEDIAGAIAEVRPNAAAAGRIRTFQDLPDLLAELGGGDREERVAFISVGVLGQGADKLALISEAVGHVVLMGHEAEEGRFAHDGFLVLHRPYYDSDIQALLPDFAQG